jgi:hypothetical protein
MRLPKPRKGREAGIAVSVAMIHTRFELKGKIFLYLTRDYIILLVPLVGDLSIGIA